MDFALLVSDFAFYCSVERRFAANTVQAYKSDLKSFGEFSRCHELDKGIDVEVLKGYLGHLSTDLSLSTATLRRRLACLRSFSAFLSDRHGWHDPFTDWSPKLKRPKRLPKALSIDDVRRLVDVGHAAPELARETVFAILLISGTGIRVSELCGIVASDVSTDGSTIRIKGKGSKDRVVYVSDVNLRQELKFRLQERTGEDGEDAALLINSRGAPLQPQTLRRRLHTLCGSQGIQYSVTPHILRHTAATLLIESGTDIRFVQRLLGHASIATTEIYTHISDRSLRQAVFNADTLGLLTNGR